MFKPQQIEREERQAAKPLTPTLSAEERKRLEQRQITEEKIILEEERIYREGLISIRDLIAPAAFQVKPSFLMLGDLFVRTLFVIGYPRYITVGWFAPIINLNLPLDISMYFYPVRSDVILKQLKKRVGNLEAQILADREKGAPRDPIRETALRDIEQLRDDLTQGIEHFFQFGLYVTVYADDRKKLERLTDDVEALFGSKLVYSFIGVGVKLTGNQILPIFTL